MFLKNIDVVSTTVRFLSVRSNTKFVILGFNSSLSSKFLNIAKKTSSRFYTKKRSCFWNIDYLVFLFLALNSFSSFFSIYIFNSFISVYCEVLFSLLVFFNLFVLNYNCSVSILLYSLVISFFVLFSLFSKEPSLVILIFRSLCEGDYSLNYKSETGYLIQFYHLF